MPTYSTPGVYYEQVDAGATAISPLRTDIAGVVGIARMGPLHRALPVESWVQFQAWFGDFTNAGYLAYAVRAFFENGGKRAWIVRVASEAASCAGFDIQWTDAANIVHTDWTIAASSCGVWGNDLDIRLVETHRSQTRLIPRQSTPEYSAVTSVTGFVRGTLVRVPIAAGVIQYRAVSSIDADKGRLYWINPDPRLRAQSPWEKPLTGVDPDASLLLESVEYTLLVRRLGQIVANYEGIAPMPQHPNYGPKMLAGLPMPPDDSRGWRLTQTPELVTIIEHRDDSRLLEVQPLPTPSPANWQTFTGGADGLAAMTLRDFIGDASSIFDPDDVRARATRGIRALEGVEEPSVIAVPDIVIQPLPPPEYRPPLACVPDPCLTQPPPGPATPRPRAVGDLPPVFSDDDVYQVQAAQVQHCETRRDRIALLDPPYDTVRDPRLGVAAIRAWRRRFDSSYAAFYFPWNKVSDPLRLGGALTREIPPCGHVAGFIAQTDLTVGVHKAPANGALTWIQDLTLAVEDATHAILNDEQINVLRAFPGRGLRIFGARTVSSDSDWLFLNVRRLMLMIEKAILIACQWATFEPNSNRTRAKLSLAITSFLIALWQRGALAGKTARSAFFVRCDDTNNPAAQRDLGQMVAEVGVAPAKPFEFVVLRIGCVDNQFEVSEADAPQGASIS